MTYLLLSNRRTLDIGIPGDASFTFVDGAHYVTPFIKKGRNIRYLNTKQDLP